MLDTVLLCTGAVALSEIGDKTQLLALALTARYKKPLPITLGIIIATLLNHGAASWFGAAVGSWLTPEILRWTLIVSFIAMGLWMLIPDKDDDAAGHDRWGRYGVFGCTLVLFFLAEMGDKTQIATIALAAKAGTVLPVLCGTTLGMLIADLPAVFAGDIFSKFVSPAVLRTLAALLFIGLGIAAYFAAPVTLIVTGS